MQSRGGRKNAGPVADEPHNMVFKLFASKRKVILAALAQLRGNMLGHLPERLRHFTEDFVKNLFTEGGDMDTG